MTQRRWVHKDSFYARMPLEPDTLVSAVWFVGHDNLPGPRFTVARVAPSVVVDFSSVDHPRVTIRRAGQIEPGTRTAHAMGFELSALYGSAADEVAATLTSMRSELAELGFAGVLRCPAAAIRRVQRPIREARAELHELVERVGRDPTRETLAEATRASGLSPQSLRRTMRNATGMTPDQFRRLARAAAARDRLRTRSDGLARIAAELGFADQAHLNREFDRWCGYTPQQWRRHTARWSGPAPSFSDQPSSSPLTDDRAV